MSHYVEQYIRDQTAFFCTLTTRGAPRKAIITVLIQAGKSVHIYPGFLTSTQLHSRPQAAVVLNSPYRRLRCAAEAIRPLLCYKIISVYRE